MAKLTKINQREHVPYVSIELTLEEARVLAKNLGAQRHGSLGAITEMWDALYEMLKKDGGYY